jgi:cytidyltransferase-like protein
MLVYRNTDVLPVFRNAVLTIGTFDGVHSGHQQVIAQMKKRALEVNGETVILTFDPHPRTVVKAAEGIRLINTMEEKIELLSAMGIDNLVIIPFTEQFAQFSAEDYISQFLIRNFHPHTLIIGYDHHFGKGRSGNFELLKKQSAIFHYHLQIPHVLNSISSVQPGYGKLLRKVIWKQRGIYRLHLFFSGEGKETSSAEPSAFRRPTSSLQKNQN